METRPLTKTEGRGDAPPVVLITGAAAGLGLALARLLRHEPFRLVLTARAASLPRFAAAGIAEDERTCLLPLDVTLEAERQAAVEAVERRWGGVDMLINNAGRAYRAVVEHITEREHLEQMLVNYVGPMELIRLVLPGMRARRRGRIINISSVGGMVAMPTLSLYSASKFALEGASEALWYEVRPWGIHISLVQPGFIRSESFRRTHFSDEARVGMDREGTPYHEHYAHMDGFIARLMSRSLSTPEDVARIVLRTLTRPSPPLRVPATLDAHLFALLRRILPRQLYHRFLYAQLPAIRRWGPHDRAPRDPR